MSERSQVSGIAHRRCSQNVFAFVIVFVFVFVFVFVNFFGHVMSSHHSEQMSQRSQVSRIALSLGRCSQNVFVFVNFFGHVMSSHHSEPMSQRSQVSRVALSMS